MRNQLKTSLFSAALGKDAAKMSKGEKKFQDFLKSGKSIEELKIKPPEQHNAEYNNQTFIPLSDNAKKASRNRAKTRGQGQAPTGAFTEGAPVTNNMVPVAGTYRPPKASLNKKQKRNLMIGGALGLGAGGYMMMGDDDEPQQQARRRNM